MRYTVTYYHDTSCFLIVGDYPSPSIRGRSAMLIMAAEHVASTGSTLSLPFLTFL